jgi:hypothetical protein
MPTRTVAGRELKHPAYVCGAKDLLLQSEMEVVTPDQLQDLDSYFRDFARPIMNIADEVSCVACGAMLTAKSEKTAQKLGRTVDVDEETGEGRCLKCGYPLRAIHRIYSRTGQLLVRLVGFPLMYHPLSTKREAGCLSS